MKDKLAKILGVLCIMLSTVSVYAGCYEFNDHGKTYPTGNKDTGCAS